MKIEIKKKIIFPLNEQAYLVILDKDDPENQLKSCNSYESAHGVSYRIFHGLVTNHVLDSFRNNYLIEAYKPFDNEKIWFDPNTDNAFHSLQEARAFGDSLKPTRTESTKSETAGETTDEYNQKLSQMVQDVVNAASKAFEVVLKNSVS